MVLRRAALAPRRVRCWNRANAHRTAAMRPLRPAIFLALPCALLLASAPLAAQQVYKWKDANGVTQYSATPPPAGASYETLEIKPRHPQAPQAADDAPAADPACVTARGNLTVLQGLKNIGPIDAGDSKRSAEQREGNQ